MTTPRFRPPQSAPGTGTSAGARRRATRTSGPPESRSRSESRPESRPRREHDGAERSRPAPAADAGGNRAARRAAAAQESGRAWDGRRDGRAPTADGPRRGRPARDGGPRRDGAAGGTDDSARTRPDGTRSGGTAAHRGGGTSNGRRPAQGDGGPGQSGPRQGGTGRGARGGSNTRGRSGNRGTGRAGGAPATTGPSATADVTLWTPPESGMPSFADLGLPERLVGALTGEGFTTPFPVQAATLPDTLAGRDLLGRGQTGSGKTLAFGLALLARLAGDRARPKAPLGLVLVPTRELATQVVEVLKPLAKAVDLRVTDVVGGMSMNKQIAELKRGVDVLVATPGRLADHLQQHTADLSEVTITVLDEADRMADMGFLPQVRAILDHTPSDGQRLLFSATLDGDVDALVRSHLTDPVTRSVAPPTAGVDTMEHHVLVVEPDDRARVVAEIAAREGRTILFVRTKHGADRWVRVLRRQGVASGPLHGGRSQSQRNKALDAFRSGEVPVLVATDVAARGIHIDDVGLVVHVDPPADPKAYLHRAGRTARAGEEGVVVTLSTPEQKPEVDLLTKQAGVRPEIAKVGPGHTDLVRVTGSREPSGEAIPEPPKPRRARKNPQGGGQRRRR